MTYVHKALRELPYRRLAVLLALLASAVGVWRLASKPVLVHTHILSKPDYRSCGAYNEEETGVTILNPFRARAPERVAEVFLRAASNAKCLPDMPEDFCRFVEKRPLPATEWRLVNRRDSARMISLFYRLGWKSHELAKHDGCAIAEVDVERTGTGWQISRYGVS